MHLLLFLLSGGTGISILATHWVAFFASIQASNVYIGVAGILTRPLPAEGQ